MNHWYTKPILRYLLPYAFGIGLYAWRAEGLYILLCLAALLIVVTWLFVGIHRRVRKGLFIVLGMGLLGYLHIALRDVLMHVQTRAIPVLTRAKYTGIVEEIMRSDSQRQTAIVRLTELHHSYDTSSPINVRVWASIKLGDTLFQPGDIVRMHARLARANPPQNWHQFDFKQYLWTRDIAHIAYLKEEDIIHVGRHGGLLWIWRRWSWQMRKSFTHVLRRYVDDPYASIAAAVGFGAKRQVDQRTKKLFAETGAIHVLAVSGLHVGMVFLFLQGLWGIFPSYFRRRHRWVFAAVSIAVIWAYCSLTGMSPSAVRASFMFSLLLIGLQLYRRSSVYNMLAISAMTLLIWYPKYLFDVGFQFSYLATLGILLFYPPIRQWIYQGEYKIGRWIADIVAVSIAAQILLLPLQAHYFHQLSFLSVFSSLVVIPLIPVVMMGTWLVLFVHAWGKGIAEALGVMLEGIIRLMYEMLQLMEQWHLLKYRDVYLHSIAFYLLVGAAMSFLLAIAYRKRKMILFSMALLALARMVQLSEENRRHDERALFLYAARDLCVDLIVRKRAFCYGMPHESREWIVRPNWRYYGVLHSYSPRDSCYLFNHWCICPNVLYTAHHTIAVVDAPDAAIDTSADIWIFGSLNLYRAYTEIVPSMAEVYVYARPSNRQNTGSLRDIRYVHSGQRWKIEL